MAIFSVGETAILVNCANHPSWEGKEVTIVGPLQNHKLTNGAMVREIMCYPFRIVGSEGTFGAQPFQLMKMPSAKLPGSWDNLSSIFKPDRSQS